MWVCGLDWAGPGYGQVLYLTIRMDLQEVGCGYVDWIGLAQNRDRCYT